MTRPSAPPAPAPSPLAETAARISAHDTYLTYRAGLPEAPSWVRFDRLAERDRLVAWLAAQVAKEGDRRAAAMSVVGIVAGAAVEAWLFVTPE